MCNAICGILQTKGGLRISWIYPVQVLYGTLKKGIWNAVFYSCHKLAEIVKFDGQIKDIRNKFRQKQAYARAL